jgi:Cu(I)/Ag(I) efflux system membrane fusion protein
MRYVFTVLLCTLVSTAAIAGMNHNTVAVSPQYMQALGVKTAPAAEHDFGQDIAAYGSIAPSTRNEYKISMQTKGWVRALPVSAMGDHVKKGQLLFTYYSPDLMSAQADYLSARRAGFKPALSEDRLRVFGMDDAAIALLQKQGRMLSETPFHAPADGIVTALPARKGSFVAEGGMVMTVQDFSTVWVNAHVPLKDLPFISKGTPATVTLAESGEHFIATVDEIFPNTDAQSRDGIVRLVAPNPDGALKTGSPVDVVFHADSAERLAVPEGAVLYDAMGAYVIASEGGGKFHAVMVMTGVTSGGMTEITDGLDKGDEVVISGQFMIDAESNLQGGMAGMSMPGMDMSGGDMSGMDMKDMKHGK